MTLRFLRLFASAPDEGGGRQQHYRNAKYYKEQADRPFHEHHQVTAGDRHGAPEIFFEHRPENEAEDEERGAEPGGLQEVAKDAEEHQRVDLEGRGTHGEDTHTGKGQNKDVE